MDMRGTGIATQSAMSRTNGADTFHIYATDASVRTFIFIMFDLPVCAVPIFQIDIYARPEVNMGRR